jgi:5'-3' exonuclease
MLGNDFLPHFPAVNIRTDGIDKLMNAYRATIGSTRETIINNNRISWKHVRKLVALLAAQEETYISTELKKRTKFEFRNFPENTPDERFMKFNAQPTYDRGMEKIIDPGSSHWRDRYYECLFDVEIDEVREKQIATNYLEGLEWTFNYYTTGCTDWRWCYKYHYPPLLKDLLKHIPYFETNYIDPKRANPVSQTMQLCYVLPKNNLDLLPEKLAQKLLADFPEWYGEDFCFHWAFCKYFWESHAQLPEIDLTELSVFLDKNKGLLVQ